MPESGDGGGGGVWHRITGEIKSYIIILFRVVCVLNAVPPNRTPSQISRY